MNIPLKVAIIRAGQRQVNLARHLGLGESTLSRIVHGYRPPSAEEMAKIARALGCEIEELWPDRASQA